jgi:hypothetical protein
MLRFISFRSSQINWNLLCGNAYCSDVPLFSDEGNSTPVFTQRYSRVRKEKLICVFPTQQCALRYLLNDSLLIVGRIVCVILISPHKNCCIESKACTALMIEIVVLWVMTWCIVVGDYQHIEDTCWVHLVCLVMVQLRGAFFATFPYVCLRVTVEPFKLWPHHSCFGYKRTCCNRERLARRLI